MNIAVAVKTGTAVVFAADSKLTAVGIAGLDPDSRPSRVKKTYENAIKIAHDRNRQLMAVVAGHASVGALHSAF